MYDLAIIGAGPGGYETALYAAHKGLNVVLFEKDKLGGTCLNWGCIPTKTILASAKLAKSIKKSNDFGIECSGEIKIDYSKIITRKDKVIELNRKGIEASMKKAGVKVVYSTAVLTGKNTIDADGTEYEAKNIIIATGTRVSSLPGMELDGQKILSSDDILTMDSLPQSMIVVGAGVMGCEFAFILSALGVSITVVEAADNILPFADKDIQSLIVREMKKSKIKVITAKKVKEIEKTVDGLNVVLDDETLINSDKLLITIGRKKVIDNVGLENIGVKLDNLSSVVINDNMQTNVDTIYAIGDITGKKMLAHVASAQGRVVVDSILGKKIDLDYNNIPAAIFTIPEVATVGLAEQDIKEEYESKVFQYRMLGKAHADGKIEGFFKVLYSKESNKILGCHIAGEHASDIIMEAAIAMNNNLTVESLINTVHPHPSFCEGIFYALSE